MDQNRNSLGGLCILHFFPPIPLPNEHGNWHKWTDPLMVKLGISMSFSTNQKASKDLWISGGNPPGLTTLTEIILRASIFLEHHCLHLFYLQDSRTTTTLFRNWKTLTIVISWQNLDRLKLNFKSIICKLLNSKGLFRSKGQFKSFAKLLLSFATWETLKVLKFPKLPALASIACSFSKCSWASPAANACSTSWKPTLVIVPTC